MILKYLLYLARISACFFCLKACPQDVQIPKVDGLWYGAVTLGAAELDIVLHIDGLSGLIDFPSQEIFNIPVGSLTCTKEEVRFTFGGTSNSYIGFFNENYTEIKGKLYQPRSSNFLVLYREKRTYIDLSHPQEPVFSYQEENVQFENELEGITLAGTIFWPKGTIPLQIAILIAGSGPHDRNQTIAGHKFFLVLADHLAQKGIASLRFDKRGVNDSTGSYENATTLDFVKDVMAANKYIKNRTEISSIGLIGHSEGGLVAAQVAAASPNIAFVVLLASPGIKGEELLYQQARAILTADGVSEEDMASDYNLRREIFSFLKEEPDINASYIPLDQMIEKYLTTECQENVSSCISFTPLNKKRMIKLLNTNWFRHFLNLDPISYLKQITAPVLAINGERDLQVSAEENLRAIEKGLKEGGNPNYTILSVPHLNHLLQTCKTGSIQEYAHIQETISPIVLDAISGWLLRLP